jgi:hypothetical protein
LGLAEAFRELPDAGVVPGAALPDPEIVRVISQVFRDWVPAGEELRAGVAQLVSEVGGEVIEALSRNVSRPPDSTDSATDGKGGPLTKETTGASEEVPSSGCPAVAEPERGCLSDSWIAAFLLAGAYVGRRIGGQDDRAPRCRLR